MKDTGQCNHFSLACPKGKSQDDLPLLLRRLADEIERRKIKPMELMDLTIEDEITADGKWWSATLYWSPKKRKKGAK
jgi:hypothetical protein